ncbi:ArsR family transcriptional regulator [Halalkaliarchaeum desulfuricum]|uniref:ArsR family transcriptional regulator n=1 Tax=Halalkaliarchaeum desulfuricum TaxID=2055893 RepID=A0A343TFQ5_9EURY|nr:winged helix-turn-helix domain-containing protein [Halalkaliarchaeum desulfuricum]AUX07927.1 ArsR family transcriptional regulator [Halalkaliarchaeum desulfuricum]
MDSLELLGSKTRLELLRALSRRDMYVSELMETVGMDGKTATHHLDTLTRAGLLDSYKEGRRRYYTLVRDVRLEISPSPDRRFVVQFPHALEESDSEPNGSSERKSCQ